MFDEVLIRRVFVHTQRRSENFLFCLNHNCKYKIENLKNLFFLYDLPPPSLSMHEL